MADEKKSRHSWNPFSSQGRTSPQPPRPLSQGEPPSQAPSDPAKGPRQPEQQHLQPPPSFQESQAHAAPPAAAASSSSSSAPVFRSQFACVTLNMFDRIRLINFPPEEVDAVREVVIRVWPEGIKDVRPYGGATEIKCRRWPFSSGQFNGDDNSRRLVMRLVNVLFDMGWVLQTTLDMSNKEYDKDALFFRKQSPPPPPCDWIIMSFDTYSKTKIIGDLPPELASGLVQVFQGTGILKRHEFAGDRLKIHLHGYPWAPDGQATVTTRMMIIRVLECMEAFGFSVYTSMDMTCGQEGRETDVMICCRQKGWVQGQPVWHR
ncbi:hypothetical protein PpBr36_02718 [Pyricularia pennisetigena]|uniref:hypothetical protein n=1 Tax=Pyricularia pennisetigena TaxID=1578925 RepID=UPI001154B91E|nr:hypothetical protein PpBr36_02718 [Pyricularia pennisetigena]TLS30553.1 hypothetical protein PpBr36_02718 [Pyricularia pennisetigena]